MAGTAGCRAGHMQRVAGPLEEAARRRGRSSGGGGGGAATGMDVWRSTDSMAGCSMQEEEGEQEEEEEDDLSAAMRDDVGCQLAVQVIRVSAWRHGARAGERCRVLAGPGDCGTQGLPFGSVRR